MKIQKQELGPLAEMFKKEMNIDVDSDNVIPEGIKDILNQLEFLFLTVSNFEKKIHQRSEHDNVGEILQEWKNIVGNDKVKYIKKVFNITDDIFLNNEELQKLFEPNKNQLEKKIEQIKKFWEGDVNRSVREQFLEKISQMNMYSFSDNKNQLVEFYNAILSIRKLLKDYIAKTREGEI